MELQGPEHQLLQSVYSFCSKLVAYVGTAYILFLTLEMLCSSFTVINLRKME